MNSRNNPFASRHVESLPFQCPDMTLADIMTRLNNLNYRAAIVGPEGSGKTTLLETICKRLRQDGYKTVYIRFNAENKRFKRDLFSRIPKKRITGHAFLVDGVEQLSWPDWKFFCLYTKHAGALIITSHVKKKMPILVKTSTSPELLYDLVLKLVGEMEMVSKQEITRLFDTHQGNIRLALRELYDVWADK
jgi:GTPase SAR1 family protein